jgi:hypothetical protein
MFCFFLASDPEYLIRYYRGEYDQGRVPYKTRAQALGSAEGRLRARAVPALGSALRQRSSADAAPMKNYSPPPPLPNMPSNRGPKYCHVAPDGQRQPFSDADNALINGALQR